MSYKRLYNTLYKQKKGNNAMKQTKLLLCIIISLLFIVTLSLSVSALHGDVNNDEYIGIEDAIIALKFATGIETPDEEQEHLADLDYDGQITTNDVRLIMRGAADIDYVPDHFFSQWETTIAPTCTEDGLATCYCFYCEKVVEKTVDKIGHTIVPATCTNASYCSVCNETFGLPLGHTEAEGYCTICNTLIASPTLTYNNKNISFGCTGSTIKTILGEPQNKYKDSSAEKTTVVYVYYTDYTDLGIFTLIDGKLTQFFTNSDTAKVTQGSTDYGLFCKEAPERIGDITLTAYADKLYDGPVYSFCATVGEGYTLKNTTNYTLSGKINLHLTNGLRALNGIEPLEYCNDVAKVATAHSTDMATRNYFNHSSPEGKRISDRLNEAGIEWYACAENIAAGIYYPYALSNGWYNSEGHRENILNERYKYLGVGFACNEKATYKYYSTQNFYTDEY